ncbi:MAG: hypothetical protein C0408_06580 [Odoribacter sp.]|nr:hypothetical protein [Odoribacter sp.]
MKNEITIPIQVQELKEKDIIAAAEHRKRYSLKRDIQAEEFNSAIVSRLAKEKEKQESEKEEIAQTEDSDLVELE